MIREIWLKIFLVSLHMIKKKVSSEPILQITRNKEVVVVEFICEKEETYKCSEYIFIDSEEHAQRFEKDLIWVSHRVNGTDFSYYANEEEVIIDHSELVSISILTGYVGCDFKEHFSF